MPHIARILRKVRSSIGTKIILPYFLLTLAVAGAGTFIITNLVTNTLEERFTNQLLDAGRVVSESMVRYEEERLQVLRAVAATQGVPAALSQEDPIALAALAPQIIANSNTDAVSLLNKEGIEVYSWQRTNEGIIEREGTDFGAVDDVRLVLENAVDEFGDKRVFLTESPHGLILFTVGPVFHEKEQVGAVMVGTYLHPLLVDLTLNAVARVTTYDQNGRVLDTTIGGDQAEVNTTLQTTPEQYQQVQELLATSPNRYHVVVSTADQQVPLQQVEVLNQRYILAYGDWRLRSQSFGLFSVALPSNFIFTTAATSRNLFSFIFALTTVGVFTIGLLVARGIIRPLHRLVQTATAVSQGNLDQETGIHREDEIGILAHSFDAMTSRLAQRNRQLLEQASELEAILHSIADGIIVLDNDDEIVTSNPAAQQLLADMSCSTNDAPLRELPNLTENGNQEATDTAIRGPSDASAFLAHERPRRFQIGERVLSTLAAPVQTPEGETLGTVIVLRDVTHEVEAEQLKDAFVTSISHELRTPFTIIKVYVDLIAKTAQGELGANQQKYLGRLKEASDQLEKHIEKLIHISELQAGTIRQNEEEVDVTQQVQALTAEWEAKMAEKELQLDVSLPSDSLRVYTDADHLHWAIDNLISNAHTYTPSGGTVSINLDQQGDQAILSVSDTGAGIAAADQPHLFKRFFRANSQINYETRGVGLGLFITRALVELYGGQITVESELGVGSTFSITLPLMPELIPD